MRCFFTENKNKFPEQKEAIYAQEIGQEDTNFIELVTRGQSHSLIRHDFRVGRITASVAHDVLHTNIDKPAKSIVLKTCCKSKQLNTPAVIWGQDNEENVIKKYKEQLEVEHENVTIVKSGLMLSKEYHFLGGFSGWHWKF